jgi:uncharacterized protein (AIM24 family)
MRSNLNEFIETKNEGDFVLQNPKLLKVRLSHGEIQAQKGSMVAYQGEVKFEHSGSGMGRMLKKMTTGEGTRLMKMSGQGEVFLADAAQNIQLLYLEDESLTVNSKNLLAFDSDIDWDIKKVSGGAAGMLAGGLFNTSLHGTGYVAVVSDGPPVLLDVGSAPTFADAQAAIAWSGGVQTSLKVQAGAKSLIGMSSGESIQLGFSGQGWVLVQPSEGRPEISVS